MPERRSNASSASSKLGMVSWLNRLAIKHMFRYMEMLEDDLSTFRTDYNTTILRIYKLEEQLAVLEQLVGEAIGNPIV